MSDSYIRFPGTCKATGDSPVCPIRATISDLESRIQCVDPISLSDE
jgi:hypothetical protein